MNYSFDFRKNLIKITVVVAFFFTIVSMAIMVAYAENKVVIVTDDVEEVDNSTGISMASKWMINMDETTTKDEKVHVLCSFDITEKNIDVTTRYSESKVIVTIDSAKDSFYLYNPPYGDFVHVSQAYGEFADEKVRITFELDKPMACEYSFSNKEVLLNFVEIAEPEETVVVIDAGHGGSSNGIKAGDILEKDVNLKIAKSIEKQADGKAYKVILIRGDDESLQIEDRLDIISMLGADYYIGIHCASDVENVKTFGMSAVYNDGYYRKGIQNVEFADMILRGVCNNTSNRANELIPAGEEELILKVLDMPATILYTGYMTNPEELSLLGQDEYIDKMAVGIIETLDSVISE